MPYRLFEQRKIDALAEAQRESGQKASDENAKRFWARWDELMNPLFEDAFERVSRGDLSLCEVLVQFLEEDPFFFRSGYWKADVIRLLNRSPLPERVRGRLRFVCLAAIDRPTRREFRSYCRLARHNKNDWLVEEVERRFAHPDPGIRLRAGWMLAALLQP